MENVVQLPPPPEAPALLIGPFETYHVVIDGRIIPNLTGRRRVDGKITLTVDNRWAADFSKEDAYQAAWLIGQASAVAAGYPHLAADTKDRPFAPISMEIGSVDPDGVAGA